MLNGEPSPPFDQNVPVLHFIKKRRKMMKEKLQSIKEEAIRQIEASDVPEKLNEVRVKFLGK